MSKFKVGDNVFYIPENEPGKVIAIVEDMPFDSEYVFESNEKKHCCRAIEADLRPLVNSEAEFERLPQESKYTALLQTMKRCQEVYNELLSQGKLDDDKLGNIDWFKEADDEYALCMEYEKTFCGTSEYEDDFIASTGRFFTEKLLEHFGKDNSDERLYRCSMTYEYTFYIRSNSEAKVRQWLEDHSIDSVKKVLNNHTGYTREIKEDILAVTDYNPNSSYGFEMINLGGEQ